MKRVTGEGRWADNRRLSTVRPPAYDWEVNRSPNLFAVRMSAGHAYFEVRPNTPGVSYRGRVQSVQSLFNGAP